MDKRVSTTKLSISILAVFTASFAIATTLYSPTTPPCIYREPLQELLQQASNIALIIAARNTMVVLLYHLVARLKPKLAIVLLYIQSVLQGFIAGAGHMPYILRICTVAPHLIPELLSLVLAVVGGIERSAKTLAIAVLFTLLAAVVEAMLTPMLCLKLALQC
ncbi:MAG TPA: hypothetical protein EYH59_02030 [Pyrodictium sp.]|nr:hypothetical protein [Pyrodictium sp.]